MAVGQDEVNVRITGQSSSVDAAMRQAASSVREATAQMRTSFDGITATIGRIQTAFAAIGAVLAGGAIFRDGVKATVDMTRESQLLGRQLGMTATQASVLKLAMGDTYVEQSAMAAATRQITTTLRQNEERFSALGIATRDANGNFRDTFTLMQEVNAKLMEFREGTDRNIEGQKIYGRSWAEVEPMLRLNAEAMAAAEEKAKSLSLVVGAESVAATDRYRAAMNDVGDVVDGLKKAIGDALLPILSELGEWFASIGPAAVRVLREAMVGLSIAFYSLQAAVGIAWDVIREFVERAVVRLLTFADVASKALRFDFGGAREAWARGTEQMKDISDRTAASIEKRWTDARQKVSDAFSRMLDPETAAGRAGGGSAGSSGGGGGSGGKDKGAKYEPTEQADLAMRMSELGTEMAERLKTSMGKVRIELDEEANRAKIEAVLQQYDAMVRGVESTLTPFSQAFQGALAGILNGTQTISQAWSRMGLSIAASIGNMVAQAIANFLKMKLVALVTGRDTALVMVKQNAAAAASAAYKAIVGIPIVGPFLAPPAAALAYAGVLAFGSQIPSARAGFDIPAGSNPLTQLHEREMVLPQKYADVVRGLAEGDGGRGEDGVRLVQINATPMPGGFFVTKDNLAEMLRSTMGADGYRYA